MHYLGFVNSKLTALRFFLSLPHLPGNALLWKHYLNKLLPLAHSRNYDWMAISFLYSFHVIVPRSFDKLKKERKVGIYTYVIVHVH